MNEVIKSADIKAIATLEDARAWWSQEDQIGWAENKLDQHGISKNWVGNLEWEYDQLLEQAGEAA